MVKKSSEDLTGRPWIYLGDGKDNIFSNFHVELTDTSRPAIGVGNQEGSSFDRFNVVYRSSVSQALSKRFPDLAKEEADKAVAILAKYHSEPEKRTHLLTQLGKGLADSVSFSASAIDIARFCGLIS